ncbi:MAG: hypothetical protein KF767_12205 [Bdellovibrionaceae bacterium]|nr:hypothetical protein [Pseudobdellovibrionaceae bacterium]
MTTTLYSYSRLALKDLDEMNKLVQDKVRESRASKGDKVAPLREAMQAVFARPNEDFMIDKVMSPLRNELDEHGAYEDTVRSLVEESIAALQKPDKVKATAQVTYAVMLENFLSDMKPRVTESFEKEMVTKIRDADISLTRKAENERKLGMMKPTKSPSEMASAIIKGAEKKKE